MDGFKTLPKMKSGGSTTKAAEKYCGGGMTKKKAGGEVEKKDMAQDKAMIKKAFKQHDKAEHDKEDASEIKLRKGGRAKKETGTVKKFKKDGGAVYGEKKTAADLKDIEQAKNFKPKKLKEGGSSDVVKEKKKPSGDAVAMVKVKPTGNKKAEAESKGTKRPALRGSDVEKEKSKPAGDKVGMAKVKPTGDKKAAAPSKGEKRPAMKGSDVKKFAGGGDTGTDQNVGGDGIFSHPDYSEFTPKGEGVETHPVSSSDTDLTGSPLSRPAAAPSAASKKAPIVTAKQLKDSGFDNLRDYLNAQRGLTRRGGPAAPMGAGAGRGGQGGPSADDMASMHPADIGFYQNDASDYGDNDQHPSLAAAQHAQAARGTLAPFQASDADPYIQGVGGPAGEFGSILKGLHGLAARLAGRGGAALSEYAMPALERSGAPQLANNATRMLNGPSKAELMAAQRATRSAGRNADMLSENAARSGVTPGTPAAQAMAEQMRRLPAPDRSAVMNKNAWAAGPGAGMGLKNGGVARFDIGGSTGPLATPQAVGDPAGQAGNPFVKKRPMMPQPQPQAAPQPAPQPQAQPQQAPQMPQQQPQMATPQAVNDPTGTGGASQQQLLNNLLRQRAMQQGQ